MSPASERLTRELSQTIVRDVATDAAAIMITTAAWSADAGPS